jgi:hypothetical protein
MGGKSYVRSSIKLNRILSGYFCIDRFIRIIIKGRSRINDAIFKDAIPTFSLNIL